jgi:hypothetical protein
LYNAFIEGLGERFASLKKFQLVKMANNFAVAGLNQDDIMDAITAQVFEAKSERTYLLFVSYLLQLGLESSNSFNTLLASFNGEELSADASKWKLEDDEKLLLLHAILARGKEQ